MGMYINDTQNGPLGAKKVQGLIAAGAVLIGREANYQPDLICVVDNGAFEAAAYCYSAREFTEFNRPDNRPKTWLRWDRVTEFAK